MQWLFIVPILVLLSSLAYAGWVGAPWVPTRGRDIERAKRLLDLKPGEKFVELGCGDGRLTIALAKSITPPLLPCDPANLRPSPTGIELSLVQYFAANVRRVLARSWNARFVLGNAFAYDLSDADAVYVFFVPATHARLATKLAHDLKPGARVVSYVWPIPGWEPTIVDESPGAPKLFLYRK